jgi:hypothetical protein
VLCAFQVIFPDSRHDLLLLLLDSIPMCARTGNLPDTDDLHISAKCDTHWLHRL